MRIFVALALIFAPVLGKAETASVYSPLTGCKKQKSVKLDSGPFTADARSGIEKCPGVGGFTVYVLSGDPRSWLALEKNGRIHSLWEMASADFLGEFPGVGGKVLEWRMENGAPRTMIARVNFQRRDATAQQIAEGKANGSMLLVYDVSVFPPRLVGHANTNEEARALSK